MLVKCLDEVLDRVSAVSNHERIISVFAKLVDLHAIIIEEWLVSSILLGSCSIT